MSSNRNVLILLAHPWLARSRVNSLLKQTVSDLAQVTLVDLYEEYPQFLIDVPREQERVLKHQLIVFQHPLYWYSCPPLLKEWLDAVLERGFAYGNGGTALRGKDYLQVVSTGGPASVYTREGSNRFTMLELLRPFEATASLCGMNYHHPLIIHGGRIISQTQLEHATRIYRHLLSAYIQEGASALKPWSSVTSALATEEVYGL